MSDYRAGDIIGDQYELLERISGDKSPGRAVWSAQDVHTGKKYIGRFSKGGGVEWFEDTRASSAAAEKPAFRATGRGSRSGSSSRREASAWTLPQVLKTAGSRMTEVRFPKLKAPGFRFSSLRMGRTAGVSAALLAGMLVFGVLLYHFREEAAGFFTRADTQAATAVEVEATGVDEGVPSVIRAVSPPGESPAAGPAPRGWREIAQGLDTLPDDANPVLLEPELQKARAVFGDMLHAGANTRQVDSLANHFLAKSYRSLERKDTYGKIWHYEWKALAGYIRSVNNVTTTEEMPEPGGKAKHAASPGVTVGKPEKVKAKKTPKKQPLFISDEELKKEIK